MKKLELVSAVSEHGIQQIEVGRIEMPERFPDVPERKDIMKTMMKTGKIAPILVEPHGETFRIVEGAGTFLAVIELILSGVKIASVPCQIRRKESSDTFYELCSFTENWDVRSRDYTRFAMIVELIRKNEDKYLRSRKCTEGLSVIMRCSPRYANMIRRIFLYGGKELQEAMLDRSITVTVADASKTVRMCDELQHLFISMIRNGERSWNAYDEVNALHKRMHSSTETDYERFTATVNSFAA